MHEFFTSGWLYALNRYVAHPRGVHVSLYLNEDPLPDGTMDDGLLVHGWECVPVERAAPFEPDAAASAERIIALDDLIQAVRAEQGPSEPPA